MQWDATGLVLIVAAVAMGLPSVGLGDERASVSPNAANASDDAFRAVLRRIVLDVLPETYENTKKWGKTRAVFDGFRLNRDGGRPRLVQRTRDVNHGTWTKYRVDLIDPERTLAIDLQDAREAPEGGLRFDLAATADIELFARISEWRYDVQLYSVNALSHARVRVHAVCDARLRLDSTRLPPDFRIEPRVVDSRVELVDFELLRVSQIHGAIAHELGQGAKRILDEWLEDKREDITAKLNRSIAKNADHLRLSLTDGASAFWRWTASPGGP